MNFLKQVSDTKAARKPERDAIVERVKIKYPSCVLANIYGCRAYDDGLDVDEKRPRGEYPEGIYDFDNCWCLCRECHTIKHHKHPSAAMKIGLYGRDRMLRWDLTVEERLPFFEEFRPGSSWDERAAKVFLHEQLKA